MSYSLESHKLQHARLPCPSLSPWVGSNSCPLSQWCYPIILFSVTPFFSCPQSFPSSGSFPVGWLFTSGCQNYWSLSFNHSSSNDYSMLLSFKTGQFDFLAVQGTLKSLLQHHSSKASFFSAQPSLWSNSYIHTWLLEKP